MVNIVQIIGAFIGVYFTSMMVDAPKKYLHFAGIIGAAGWGLYLLLHPLLGVLLSNYLAGLFVAFSAHFIARWKKTPVTVILIPGYYPLVPGVGMYKTILYLIQNQDDLFKVNLKLTLLTACMIALSIFTADAIVNTYFRAKRQIRKYLHPHISPFKIKKL